MRVAFVVNDINSEWPGYTTTHVAMAAANRDHEVWYISVGDFSLHADDHTYALARSAPKHHYRSAEAFIGAVRGKTARVERIVLDDLDVMLLRNDPNQDVFARPWARMAAINFGRLAMRHGVIVLNHPDTLALSLTKLYLQDFPSCVRPATMVTRDRVAANAFIGELGGYAVIKPLYGSGGRNVFLVRPEDAPNVTQMLEAVLREGYAIVQEFLPEAVHGDTRLFLVNGGPLECKGRIAAVHRQRKAGDADIRSNLTAGAVPVRAEITDTLLALAERVRDRLVQDGIFLCGLDCVGDKLLEVNVLSPGALVPAERIEGVPFCKEIVLALERKTALRREDERLSNLELAML